MKIFSFKSIPIYLHYSFLILASAYIIFQLVTNGLTAALTSLLFGGFLFGSVLLHEIGHSVAALSFGITTRDITLYPFGGIASIKLEPITPDSELIISAAGPAVNFILAGLCFPLVVMKVPYAFDFVFINAALGFLNLVPAFPMDGGRILRSLLMKKMSQEKATSLSIKISKVFAISFIGLGFYWSWIGLMLVGLLLFFITNYNKIN